MMDRKRQPIRPRSTPYGVQNVYSIVCTQSAEWCAGILCCTEYSCLSCQFRFTHVSPCSRTPCGLRCAGEGIMEGLIICTMHAYSNTDAWKGERRALDPYIRSSVVQEGRKEPSPCTTTPSYVLLYMP